MSLIKSVHIFTEENVRKLSLLNVLAFTTVLASTACVTAQPVSQPQEAQSIIPGSHFKKVVWLIFENESRKNSLAQPDFKKLTQYGAYLSNMTAETHPSQGNYIAMVAGSTLGVSDDGNVDLDQTHIGDLIEKVGLDWRVYAEDYPGNCFTRSSSGKYVRKHTPFLSFTNVTKNPTRCAKVESTNRFFDDLKNDTLPAFSMFIPNQDNDGHDTGVDFAGKWMWSKFGSILSNPASLRDTLFIVTFDEASFFSSGNKIYTVLVGSNVIPGSQNSQNLNHISLLKMIEDEFQLGTLGREDSKQPQVTGIWK